MLFFLHCSSCMHCRPKLIHLPRAPSSPPFHCAWPLIAFQQKINNKDYTQTALILLSKCIKGTITKSDIRALFLSTSPLHNCLDEIKAFIDSSAYLLDQKIYADIAGTLLNELENIPSDDSETLYHQQNAQMGCY